MSAKFRFVSFRFISFHFISLSLYRYIVIPLLLLLSLVHGNWSDWASWSSCTVTCGSGRHNRTRTCTEPSPAYGGEQCVGGPYEVDACSAGAECPGSGQDNFSHSV